MATYSIVECNTCGSAFSQHVPPAEDLEAVYERLYGTNGAYQRHRDESEDMRTAFRRQQRISVGWEGKLFFRRCRPGPDARLLDVGCGTGLFLAAAGQRGWSPCGVELSSEAAHLGQQVHGLPVHRGRLEDAPPQWNGFAAITAWEVLEHIPEPREFLRLVFSRLRAGGVFAGSVPNYARPRYRFGNDLGVLSVPPVHLNFWTPDALSATLRIAGFQSVQVVVPRASIDVLKPLARPQARKIVRFAKLLLGADVLTSAFFVALKHGGLSPRGI